MTEHAVRFIMKIGGGIEHAGRIVSDIASINSQVDNQRWNNQGWYIHNYEYTIAAKQLIGRPGSNEVNTGE